MLRALGFKFQGLMHTRWSPVPVAKRTRSHGNKAGRT